MSTQNSPSRLFVFLLIAFFAIAGCQPTTTPTEASSTDVPLATSPVKDTNSPITISKNIFLDPALAQDKDSLMIAQYIYEGLVVLDAAGKPQPGIAESWVISDDQLDYIFTLRSGATFSDGSRITPDIVADNFNRWFDPNNPLHKNGDFAAWKNTFLGFLGEKDDNKRAKSTVDGIQKVDSNTVLLHLTRPTPETLTNLAKPAFAILSTKALASGNYGKNGSTIISSGAYTVSSWKDTSLILSPNSKYWGKIPSKDLNFVLQ